MAALSDAEIRRLLEPFYSELTADLTASLSTYLELLLKWNARTNMTAIREPSEIVRRHFGESLFLAAHLPPGAATLLDLGSGAGFPGLPVQMARKNLRVVLAESQNKKAAFLREATRLLGVSTEVWADRAEKMVGLRRFDVVALRAVDRPEQALELARALVGDGGVVMHLTALGGDGAGESARAKEYRIPGSESTVLRVY